MKIYFLLCIVLTIVIFSNVDGRYVIRPLSASEVYQVLREAGREDAIPEGRQVSHGIAAISGFALGLAKGIGGATLVGLATSAGGQQYLQNMLSSYQGLNMTALTSLFSGGTGATATAPQVQTQEICFSSRNLNEISEADEEDDGVIEARQAVGSPTTTTSYVITPGGDVETVSTPTTDGTNTGTATNTDSNTGTGSGSLTTSSTQTGEGPLNCIVIERPVTG